MASRCAMVIATLISYSIAGRAAVAHPAGSARAIPPNGA